MSFKLSLAASKEQVFNTCGKLTLPKKFNPAYQQNAGDKVFCVLGINPERMYTLEWGLIPHWSKTLNNRFNMISVDANGAINRPSSRIPFRKKRGYILCDGFYFIKKRGQDNIPYRIVRKDGQLMRIACIWDEWENNNNYISSTAMLTQRMNGFIAPRCPVVLDDEHVNTWLHGEDIMVLNQIANFPINEQIFNWYKVTDKLCNTTYQGQDLYVEIPEEINLFSFI